MTKLAIPLCCAALALLSAGAQAAGVDHQNLSPRAGSWSYAVTTTGSEAVFSDVSRQSLLIVRCTRQTRRVGISGRVVPAASLMIWSSSVSRSIPAAYNPTTGFLSAELAANDPLLDGIAFSRGHFSITAQGSAPLVVPNWPEPTRAIEDCRN